MKTTSPIADPHADAQALLPWFANGSLDAAERARVQAHLDGCAACRRQLEEERRIATVVRDSAVPARSPEPGLARLMATIAARDPQALPIPKAAERPWWSRWRLEPSAPRWSVALAGAGALAIVATLGATVVRVQEPESFHVLGLAPATRSLETTHVHVVMAPTVEPARREAILAIVDGRIVEGPNSVGAYTVRIAASGGPVDLAGALDRLRAQPDVLLAEAVTPLAMPHVGPDLVP